MFFLCSFLLGRVSEVCTGELRHESILQADNVFWSLGKVEGDSHQSEDLGFNPQHTRLHKGESQKISYAMTKSLQKSAMGLQAFVSTKKIAKTHQPLVFG